MIKFTKIRVLCWFLNCSPEEIKMLAENVYEWRGVKYELVARYGKTAPSSHYVHIKPGSYDYYIRELGEKSQIIKQMKGK